MFWGKLQVIDPEDSSHSLNEYLLSNFRVDMEKVLKYQQLDFLKSTNVCEKYQQISERGQSFVQGAAEWVFLKEFVGFFCIDINGFALFIHKFYMKKHAHGH